MINSLWIAKTGMEAQQTQLDVISHNLANVSTTGYKRANAVFEDLIYQNLRQVGAVQQVAMHQGYIVKTHRQAAPQHHHVYPLLAQVGEHVAAQVAAGTGEQNLHTWMARPGTAVTKRPPQSRM